MRYRPLPFKFGHHSTTKQTRRYIINDIPTTLNDQLYPQIPYLIRSKRYNIKNKNEKTLAGRLFGLTHTVTRLFRDERIVCHYNRATEVRPYAERLIVEAMRYGDKHRPTMELANYWLRDKSLIHKLFKEFVPRYENYCSAFTAIHLLGKNYSLHGMSMTEWKDFRGSLQGGPDTVLEMRGSELPAIVKPKLAREGLLTNILIDGARTKA